MPPLRRTASAVGPFEANLMRTKLYKIIKEKSFFRARIRLASGKESDFYFDMKPTMFCPEGALALAEMIVERIASLDVDFVGGLAVGAIPLVSVVAMASEKQGRPIPGFFVRKEVKDHGTKKTIDGLARNESLQGKRVVILEDVTTTGGSALIAANEARKAGADVVLVLAIVDREEGAADSYKEAGLPFEALFRASEFFAE
jgi:orotate phosphoribosyltransferase